ncbi:four helix bundle protein [Labilibaculum sp. A4]|uniref:four helix bundle protein n=1 Tax=Labilibaculum euxinus TaxID=2686357 RepID=UPI000F62747E|nr:four helix bundle protein [Labilibaculum euxinus]MDQ1771213.1 four helix bundle protein [Labilibaculum euxinus]MWN76780.1 four helix bundle protein [Labilibaculum euxinus]
MENNLQKRLFQFSIDVIQEVRNLPNSKEYQVISYQILKSATSVGANYEEAQGAVSKADFANKVGISLKEIRETNYWIRIIIAIDNQKMNWAVLEKESSQLIKILGAIYNKTAKKNDKSLKPAP